MNAQSPASQSWKPLCTAFLKSLDQAAKIVALYPTKAADAGIQEGTGVADCLVAPDGRMTDCHIAREAPADMGFGAAAVLVVGVMQMDPWTPEGRPVAGARVKVPIQFSLAPEPAADAPAAP